MEKIWRWKRWNQRCVPALICKAATLNASWGDKKEADGQIVRRKYTQTLMTLLWSRDCTCEEKRKEERRQKLGQTSRTHVELIIRGQERHWQQCRQTFIRRTAGKDTAPLQLPPLSQPATSGWKRKGYWKLNYYTRRFSCFSPESAVFSQSSSLQTERIVRETETERKTQRQRESETSLTRTGKRQRFHFRRGFERDSSTQTATCVLRTRAIAWMSAGVSACLCVLCVCVFMWTLPVCVFDKTVITAGLSSGPGRRMGKRKQSSVREEASW